MIYPKGYNSLSLRLIVQVEAKVTKKGDFFYLATYRDNDNVARTLAFKNMSSVLDFINMNFTKNPEYHEEK